MATLRYESIADIKVYPSGSVNRRTGLPKKLIELMEIENKDTIVYLYDEETGKCEVKVEKFKKED